jgi:Domain of Unknown Function (DUF1080)
MQRLLLTLTLFAPLCCAQSSPFAGRWDFSVTNPTGVGANWLGVKDNGGTLEITFQPTGGNVYPVKDFKVSGNHLQLNLSPPNSKRGGLTWELEAAGDKLTGTQKRGETTLAITGVRSPELNRKEPKSWSKPEPLFDGVDLKGWEPIGDPSKSHWSVKDGELYNAEHGANLKTTREFNDFKVHFEVNCPDDANSGFYLRGRYEVQLEYEPLTSNPPERRIGSIYGRITPQGDLPRTPGKWETFDVTLVGRTVTIMRNGVTTVDHQIIDGITGGALNANEGNPGPFYIQGDHTGGLKFRNITVSVPK